MEFVSFVIEDVKKASLFMAILYAMRFRCEVCEVCDQKCVFIPKSCCNENFQWLLWWQNKGPISSHDQERPVLSEDT